MRSIQIWTLLVVVCAANLAIAGTTRAQEAGSSGNTPPPTPSAPSIAPPPAAPATVAPATVPLVKTDALPPAPAAAPGPAAAPALAAAPPPELISIEGTLMRDGMPLIEDGETLTFRLKNLATLEANATKANPITLFLADMPVTGSVARRATDRPEALKFDLTWTEESRKAWTHVLGRAGDRPSKITAAVGLADGKLMASSPAPNVQVDLVRFRVRWILIAALLLGTALLAYFAKLSRLLRVSSKDDASASPYSLGRAQMAWWFANILAAYLVIWGAVGAIDTITPQMLVLMGISASTALGAVVIDQSKLARAEDAVRVAKAAVEAAPNDVDKQAALVAAQQALKDRQAETMPQSQGFLTDILSDNDGYSLHRFQVLVWTLVVAVIFWYSVWRDLAMPQLGDTLLALMGISAGTYLGFKFPEK
jgi:hypothetical protein